MPEIIIGTSNAGIADKLEIYRGDGSNLNSPMVLTVPGRFDNYPVPGPTIGDVNNDGTPELLISCYDRRIRVFTAYTENPAAPMTLWITSSAAAAELLDWTDTRVSLADFDGDGTPEVYAGSDIYRFDFSAPGGPTLVRVISGPNYRGRAMQNNYAQGSCNPAAVDILSVADCNGDPDCGGLELVAGPVIYSIDLDPSDGDGVQIKIQRDLNQIQPGMKYEDGYTSVADLDLDGVLDIAVSGRRNNNSRGVYVWNKNKFLQFFPFPLNHPDSGSLPCIANVHDDGGTGPDLPEILVCCHLNFTCFNLNAAKKTPAAPYWWNLPTTDGSGWTGSTVYDFNGDGILEVVYRDEQNLRILYGGPVPFPPGVDAQRNWFKTPCFSGTSDEYAVVADLDNDGETEIAITGQTTNLFNGGRGRIRVYESDSGPWVPSRNLWNQYNYFVVNVNDDLSIPAVQMLDHHLELPAIGSGKRPLNRYLAQRPVFNPNYEVTIPLPDASAQAGKIACSPDSLTIELRVCNTGDKVLKARMPVAFYQSDPTATAALLLGTPPLTPAAVPIDSCAVFTFSIPKMLGTIYGVANDNGTKPRPYLWATDFPVTNELECHWPNNIFQFNFQTTTPPLALGPDLGSCHDTLVTLNARAGFVAYRWQDGSTDSTFQVQNAGLYWVETTDFCQQKTADTVRVATFGYPTLQLDTLNGDCYGRPAQVLANAASFYPPLSYKWSSGHTDPSLSGLPDGLYTVTVTNAKGCATTDSTWVEAGGLLQVAATTTPIQCFGQTGAVQVNFSAGKPPYTYQWSDGSTGPDLPNASAGDHSVTVTDADGCAQILQISLTQPTALSSAGIEHQPACPSESNGGTTFLGATQGTPPYTLRWSNSATTPSLTGLPAGPYALTVTDANGCELIETVQVSEFSAPVATTAVSDVRCFGEKNGSAALALTGGTPGFAYTWSSGSAAPKIEGLAPGTYTLTLTYASERCTQIFDFQVKEPLPILLSASLAPLLCHGSLGGSINLAVQNGTTPLVFLWSNGNTTEDPTGLSAGTYTVTVTDAAGCSKNLTASVSEPTALTSAGISPQPACPGEANGGATFLGAAQATPPYALLWSSGATVPNLTGLAAGVYTLTVTDVNGCTLTETAQVPEFSAPTAATTVSDVRCFGEKNGSVAVSLSSGSPGFGYAWSSGSAAPKIEALAPGTYTLTLTYADGKCAQTFDYQIKEPLPILLSATSSPAICNGGLGGSIDVTVQNGVAPLTFLWSNGSGLEDPTDLTTGTYTATVTDAAGCTKTYVQAVGEQPSIALSATWQEPKCAGSNDGDIQISPSGGTSPFQFKWSNGASSAAITGLAAGAYTVTITDTAACTEVMMVSLDQPTTLTSAGISAQAACPGEANGSAFFLGAAQATPPYELRWSTNDIAPVIGGLASGSYALTITDANGCSLVETTEVPEFTPPTSSATVLDVSCFGKKNGSIAVVLTGGSPGFGYAWSTLSAQPKIENLAPGTYTLTLTYADGSCAQIFDYQVKEPPLLGLLDPAVTPAKCFGGATGAVSLTAAGGIAPYQFAWSGGQKTEDIAQVAAGNYTLTLTDANGCTTATQFAVPQPDVLTLGMAVGADTCESSDGKVAAVAAGGIAPYQFAWSNGSAGPALPGLFAGTYALTLTDANGCTHALPVQVPAFGKIPVLTPFAERVTCAQPMAMVSVLANQGGLHYAWSGPGGALGDQPSHSVSTGGLYAVTATNAFGCQAVAEASVSEDKAAPTAEAGPPSLRVPCTETKFVLSAAGSSQGSGFENRWTQLPGGLDTLAITVPIFEPGLYVHMVLNLMNGCSAQDSVRVEWDEPIRASASVEDVRCFGYDDGEIRILNATGGHPPLRYSIDNLNFTPQNTFVGLPPGTYPVRAEDAQGCWWETSVTLTQPDSLAVRLTVSDTSIELGRYVNLKAQPLPKGAQWSDIVWGPGGLVFLPKSLTQKVKPEEHTEFVVQIFDQNGCWAEDRVRVRVHNYGLYVPNVILPGSGTNGYLTIFAGEGVSEIRLLRVYDRWGGLVFERLGFAPNDPAAGWDGSFREQPLSPGVLGWYAEVLLQDGQVLLLKGDVTVVR